jgi:Zn-dependent M28 family amino/carboxypeptidase
MAPRARIGASASALASLVSIASIASIACDGATSSSPAPPASSVVSAPPRPRPSRAEREASARVTAANIVGPLRYLSDDLLEGRAPGTRGSELAIKYIASEYEAMGLQPGGDGGTWLQKVPLVGLTASLPPAVRFDRPGAASLALGVGEDVMVRPGRQTTHLSFDAPDVVFVGYGIVAPDQQWDDYKDADVRGKVVLVMNDDPSSDPKLFEGKARTWFGRWDYKYLEAARHGAAAAIVIHTAASAGYPWQVVASSFPASEKFELPAGEEPRLEARMWATEKGSRAIAALGGKDLDALRASAESRDFRPVPLGVHTALAFDASLRQVESANVVGVLPGRDAKLGREAVVFTAHHDHLGVGTPKNGDAIYNGALDNASGVASMLAIARAAAQGRRPRRSLVFLAVTAEEQGLLGSFWYARHPTFAPELIAANLNIDCINRFGATTDVSYVGYGRSSLDAVVESVAGAQGRTVRGDAYPSRGSFYRSDQFSFARIGVPVIDATGGPTFVGRPPGWGREQFENYERTRYHQPSDELDASWDFAGAVEDAQLLLVSAMRIAEADGMPTWRVGDEFEKVRKP